MAQIRARVWLDPQPETYPELALPDIAARPSTGLCLSGGGTRAMVAGIGYLRGLLELGLLDRLRYISAVSGGSWAAIPYSFWQRGASDDAELLGPILAPQQLDRATLEAPLPATYLGRGASESFRDRTLDGLPAEGPALAWNSAAGELFLQPWGLYDRARPRSFTWSAATRDAILARQAELPGGPRLTAEDFLLARPNRPFPIVSAALLGPLVGAKLAGLDPLGFEFTPLYAGVPSSREVGYRYAKHGEVRRRVGGGLLEPFALDGAGPGWLTDAAAQTLTLEHPEQLCDLSFVIGSSSSAFASTIAEKLPTPEELAGRIPTLRYWPPAAGDVPRSRPWELGDGGVAENFGIFPLLARGVETIIVLVNTKQKLGLDWDPGAGSYQPHIDPYIPPLFGVHEVRAAIDLRRNQVFPSEEFAGLVRALQAGKREQGPVIAVREHRVLDNPWWGVRGGRSVRVAWVYLDRVPAFEALLPKQTQAAIGLGSKAIAAGPFQRFPNYKTIGTNALSFVRLEPGQIRLLANLCTWSVLDQRACFEELLG